MKCLDTPYFAGVSYIPPCSSIEHFWQPIDQDYPAFITTFEMIPLSLHGICHTQNLTCMGHTYTLDITNLVGPLQEIAEFAQELLLWTCCLIPFSIGLLVTFISISNIFSQFRVVIGFSTNANTNAITIISGSL